MDFGLWVEPEMVNPDSDLYREHPDWAMHFPGRPRTEARNQLVLNMARDDVKEYIFGWLDKLVSENNIAFLKWDMNRNFSEPGWPEAAPAEQKKIWVKYVSNVYEIIDRLRAQAPQARDRIAAPAAAAAWTWASCSASTRSGPRTTPTRSTGCASRKVSASLPRAR